MVCGAPDEADTCVAPHLAIASQSISGTVTMSGSLALPPTTFTQKIDLEQFSYHARQSVSMDFPNPVTNETMTVQSNVTLIVSVAEKHAIEYIETDDPEDGRITKTCMLFPLPDEMPDAAALKAVFEALLSAAKCGGSDGTYDTWKYGASYDGPVPNGIFPFPTAGLTVKGCFGENIAMSHDSLLHSVHSTVNVDVKQDSETLYSVSQTVDTSISSVEAGGPSAADLDPAQFGVNCTTPGEFDSNTFFTRGTPTNLQQHVLTTLRSAARPQHAQIVGRISV